MKLRYLYLFVSILALGSMASGQKKPVVKKFKVSGKIVRTASYCGGARPTEEMMTQATKAKPYVGKTLYVKRGMSNSAKEKVLTKFTAGKTGTFSLTLPAGTYVILQYEQTRPVDSLKVEQKEFITVDKSCLKEWWVKPYYVLEVTDKDVKGLQFDFHKRCFVSSEIPCINYSGPMPP